MKLFLFQRRRNRRGFTLAESAFSVGLFSFGFLSLEPLLSLGLHKARAARDNRLSAQIAEAVTTRAEEGQPIAGTGYYDSTGAPGGQVGACFRVETKLAPEPTVAAEAKLSRLTVRVVPVADPDHGESYAVVFATR